MSYRTNFFKKFLYITQRWIIFVFVFEKYFSPLVSTVNNSRENDRKLLLETTLLNTLSRSPLSRILECCYSCAKTIEHKHIFFHKQRTLLISLRVYASPKLLFSKACARHLIRKLRLEHQIARNSSAFKIEEVGRFYQKFSDRKWKIW